ncbi:PAS domain-containing sensor histidine kinase [Massilia sp. YIM B02769]|uniref:PAS domain-containing sensor histidine kinase n=1 Tax=unclassified Massilia TaxID=2609279 RepID=UPI0025B6C40A|nr:MULTISPECIES: PAS domain-containing sensor histidine kinase [unclassified Massilia]MDN4060376.1 PAS domain-containing sensor histidine kinase [Massilia sp. YIM B02769]
MTLKRNPRRRGRGAALFALGLLGGHLVARLNTDGQADAPTRHSRRIVDNAGEAIISADEFSRVVLANPAAAAMFGVSVAQMLGQPLARFIRAPANAGHSLLDHFQGGRAGRRSTDYAGVGIRPNGSFPIEGSITDAFQDGVTLYTIILRDVSERQRVQEKLARSHDQLRQLSAALQTIREEERTHIARELHDDLGQLLASLRMDLTLLRQARAGSEDTTRLIAGMDDNLLTAITSLRRIATNLRPRALDEGGLYFALQGLRDDFVERHGIACELLADEAELRLADGASTAVFRIVQEALTNVARHAKATYVILTLYRSNGELLVTIRDNGRGIVDADMEKAESLGLVGMRERVWGLGGEISIGSDNGFGTRIDVVLPIAGHTV